MDEDEFLARLSVFAEPEPVVFAKYPPRTMHRFHFTGALEGVSVDYVLPRRSYGIVLRAPGLPTKFFREDFDECWSFVCKLAAAYAEEGSDG